MNKIRNWWAAQSAGRCWLYAIVLIVYTALFVAIALYGAYKNPRQAVFTLGLVSYIFNLIALAALSFKWKLSNS